MRITIFSIVAGLLLPPATAEQAGRRGTQAQGILEAVTASGQPGSGTVEIALTGRNPCATVALNYGDGTQETLSIGRLPTSLRYDYAQAGTYRVAVRGLGACTGQAATSVRLTTGNEASTRTAMRFRGLDRDRDGVITRSEWRGSSRSFDVHDWNADGVLSGSEILAGNRQTQDEPVDYNATDWTFRNWTRAGFAALDHDATGYLTLDEWHYDTTDFWRADRNRDNRLDIKEFLSGDFDDDRGDRFLYLDGDSPSGWDAFASLDVDNSETLTRNEWHWTRASFDTRDTNNDGVLSRLEFGRDDDVVEIPAARRIVTIDPTRRWTSTRVVVSPGDVVTFEATGTIQMNEARTTPAGAAGAADGRTAPASPLPRQPAGALIGRIDDGPAFFIGTGERGYRAPNGGILYLGVNDDHLPDNSGAFRVVVTIRQ